MKNWTIFEQQNKSVGSHFCYTIVTNFRKIVAIPLLINSTKFDNMHYIR